MKNLFYIAWLCLTFAACSREELPDLSSGNPASLILSINTMQNDVQTRAVSPDVAEKRIFNLYVFVFNADGSIDYQKYHTFNSVVETKNLTINELTCGSGKSVAVVANIDNANTILNIKQATLDAITSRRELEALIVIMQNQSIERGTSFMTSGITENVTISANGSASATVSLKRVDAKIRFNITTPSDVVFTPSDWRVVNVPQKIRVMGSQPQLNLPKGDCFDTEWAKFEDGGATFAFYSMEHILTPKTQIPIIGTYDEQYALREKQDKTPGQGISVINGNFTYAPLAGTYVEMRGHIQYTSAGKEISADVVYTVHLGGVDKAINDYNTRRNTFYTYNVKIQSVDKIVIEVDSQDEEDEQRPGGEGDVTAAQTILSLDACNETFLLTLNQSQVDATLTWNVYTPFSRGAATDNPLDYKWIYFKINSKTSPNQYTNNFQPYPGDNRVYEGVVDLDSYMVDIASGQDKMLDVKQLVVLLQESKERLISNNPNHLFDTYSNVNFTAFVNENYYETSPDGTSTAVDGFWKQFTNRQQRVMNILSDLKYSPDHESSKSNAVYSIRQHAIQTMYNRSSNENFTAWGTQMIQDETPIVFDKNSNSYVFNAIDHSNGRENTIALWGLPDKTWNHYITQGTWSMVSDYNTAKYKCLRMNRDNDGDGTIDEDEVQWYLAAINQLTDIWIGEWSYDPAARLYKKTTWEKHYVVSSTVLGSSGSSWNRKDDPQILWASEGSSIGLLTGAEGSYSGTVNTPVYYRCVRNLGVPRNANIDTRPSELAEYDQTTHRISLKRLDAQSIRSYYQETEELPVHHEREASNKPYREFEVRTDVHGGSYTWQSLFDYTQAGNRLCPDGYRIPNQRELALMLSRIGPDGNWTLKNHFSRTSFRFSTTANYRPGFSVNTNGGILFLTHGNNETGGVRCVKDYVQGKSQ